jgi:BlaI family penicillinase repressor
MGENDPQGLTKLELELMQVIWRQGESSVAEVQTGLDTGRGADAQRLAYTTVQTMLNILERKGKLQRTLRGRAYVYAAAVSEEKASGFAVRDLIDRMFGGSSEELVMSLIKSRQIDAKKIAELTRRLEKEGAE